VYLLAGRDALVVAPRERTEITWSGAEPAIAWLGGLREGWRAVLDKLIDADLLKNVSEIGQLRTPRHAA
jgi:hypothetical protein